MVTKSQRRLGRTIRVLERSVELSSKENSAKESEKKYRENVRPCSNCEEDSPIQSLHDPIIHRKKSTDP